MFMQLYSSLPSTTKAIFSGYLKHEKLYSNILRFSQEIQAFKCMLEMGTLLRKQTDKKLPLLLTFLIGLFN